MKNSNNPIDDRQITDNGLAAIFKTLRQKPTWIKTRRFFWAVGVVLWEDVIPTALAVGEAATESDAAREKENARVLHSREAEDIYGNPQ